MQILLEELTKTLEKQREEERTGALALQTKGSI